MTKQIILTCCALTFSFTGVQAEESAKPDLSVPNTRPNILFIFADDWGWGDLSCHGHPHIKTPNIDRIAKEGTDFQRFTVASGVCSPSRAAVMTGHFPARYAINGHFAAPLSNARRKMPDWLDINAPLLPRMLQKSGYRTAHFGKWHLANNMIIDSPNPQEYGYDVAWAFNCSGEQMPVHEDAMHSIEFIKKSHTENKPFFLNLWMHEPHTPFHTVPKYEWRFRHLKSRAEQIYASVLSHADDRVGQILDTLDDLNIADNTLVIFSSDNGPATGRGSANPATDIKYDSATGAGFGTSSSKGTTGGRKGRKTSLFEGGIGVPFLARWPKHIAAGKVDDSSLISAVDLLPTFCSIAGAEMPENYKPDGLNITNILKGETMPSRDKMLFWHFPVSVDKPKPGTIKWVSYAAVKGQWKIVFNHDFSYYELYRIDSDVYESKDLAAENPEVIIEFTKEIDDWRKGLPHAPTGDVFSKHRPSLNRK